MDVCDEPVTPVQDALEPSVRVLAPLVQAGSDHHERGTSRPIQRVHQTVEARIEDPLRKGPEEGVRRAEARGLEDRRLAVQDGGAVPRTPCRVEPGAERADLAGRVRCHVSRGAGHLHTGGRKARGHRDAEQEGPRHGAGKPTHQQTRRRHQADQVVGPVVPTSDDTADGGPKHCDRGHGPSVATIATQQRNESHHEQQHQPAQQSRPEQLVKPAHLGRGGLGEQGVAAGDPEAVQAVEESLGAGRGRGPRDGRSARDRGAKHHAAQRAGRASRPGVRRETPCQDQCDGEDDTVRQVLLHQQRCRAGSTGAGEPEEPRAVAPESLQSEHGGQKHQGDTDRLGVHLTGSEQRIGQQCGAREGGGNRTARPAEQGPRPRGAGDGDGDEPEPEQTERDHPTQIVGQTEERKQQRGRSTNRGP